MQCADHKQQPAERCAIQRATTVQPAEAHGSAVRWQGVGTYFYVAPESAGGSSYNDRWCRRSVERTVYAGR
jgi:hypothetical protein